ncbi:sulfurtransferase [Mangrovactinospora gilvigrisea]|uniref:Sulfurtransferase n=1 Tax=Mangrovactinospora gilvigrisea TaxID=1428644 RepID=A0A1J7BBX7_9ACTN|nr:sulfurtransferase [Mangrovactinospora gilvigrisea]OIV36199.1 sulfurtransferase [Mangrovactinospora gilvigrisea]
MATLLTTPQELIVDIEGDEPPVLLDIRYELNGPSGSIDYAAGHIPGAHWIDLDRALAGEPGAAGRHPLPDPAVLGAALRRAGVTADRPVVVYDGGNGMGAARAWWTLRYFGHPDVRVLDGGYAAWTAQDLPGSTEPAEPEDGDFEPRPGGMPLLDADAAVELAHTGLLFDARAAERYRGEVEPIDKVAGHIPGARSLPTAGNMAADGRFRPVPELVERFAAAGAEAGTQTPVGVYCGSGVSAAQQVIALALADIPAALYVGSWSEWSSDPARKVATGPTP